MLKTLLIHINILVFFLCKHSLRSGNRSRPQAVKYTQTFSSILMFKYANDTFAIVRRSQVQNSAFVLLTFFSRKKKILPTAIKNKTQGLHVFRNKTL